MVTQSQLLEEEEERANTEADNAQAKEIVGNPETTLDALPSAWPTSFVYVTPSGSELPQCKSALYQACFHMICTMRTTLSLSLAHFPKTNYSSPCQEIKKKKISFPPFLIPHQETPKFQAVQQHLPSQVPVPGVPDNYNVTAKQCDQKRSLGWC